MEQERSSALSARAFERFLNGKALLVGPRLLEYF